MLKGRMIQGCVGILAAVLQVGEIIIEQILFNLHPVSNHSKVGVPQ
jgi:hypothetical protein